MPVSGVAPAAVGIIAATTVLDVLATVAITARFIARRPPASSGLDDWVALSAYIFFLALSVCHFIISAPYGYAGHNQANFDSQQLKQFLIIIYADNICYTFCTTTIKAAITLLLRRVFPTRPFHLITAVLGGILVVWGIFVLFFQIFSCTPVHSFWDYMEQEHCIDTTMFYNGVAVSNVLFDSILLILPIPMVWQLQMDLRRKLQVSFVFVLGGFTIICSILRTVSLTKLDINNETSSICKVGIWTIIECGVGVICSCLPPTARLFRKLSDKVRTTIRSTERSQKAHDDMILLEMERGSTGFKKLRSGHPEGISNNDMY